MTDSISAETTPGPIKRWLVLLVCALIVLTIDQATKGWVVANLAPGQSLFPVPALADFFAITRSANQGAAFSLLPQASTIFLLIALGMTAGIIIFYPRMQGRRWLERIALGLLLGGVVGNALDRLRYGYVIDFVHLQLRPFISNISNLADHAIVLGIMIFVGAQWWAGRKQSLQAQSEERE